MRIIVTHDDVVESAECVREDGEYVPYIYDTELEYTVDEVEFDREDLERIVDKYTKEIIDILLRKHYYELLKAFKDRKTKAPK